jgi:DNA excision repair protein ERCC-5
MGVHGLWTLLGPVGRRVSIETLERKTLAVDVSIWLVKFIKTMRDEEGKVAKNAHIIGTLRRVVRLLFHRIRPVFVFDGGAPALKEQTLRARRRLRNNAEVNVTKTAQRILTVRLKTAAKAAARAEAQAKADAARAKAEGTVPAPAVPGMAPGFNPGGDGAAVAEEQLSRQDSAADSEQSLASSSGTQSKRRSSGGSGNPFAVVLPVADSDNDEEEAGLAWETGQPSDSDELEGWRPRKPAAAPSAGNNPAGAGSDSGSDDDDDAWEDAVVLPNDEKDIDLEVKDYSLQHCSTANRMSFG